MAEAVGILEVFGLTTAFVAGDAGCKAANVRLEVFDKNKPANADSLPVPLLVCIKFRGSVTDVTAAVEAGMEVANRRISSCISIGHQLKYNQIFICRFRRKQKWHRKH